MGASGEAGGSKVEINWKLAPSDKVGSEKSGAACFPNGTLHWQELAKPDSETLASQLKSLLASSQRSGISASGELISLKAMVCSAWLGMGAQPKSEIKLSIQWSLQSEGRPPFETAVETSIARKKFDLRIDPALLQEAVETNFKKALLKI